MIRIGYTIDPKKSIYEHITEACLDNDYVIEAEEANQNHRLGFN